MTNYKQPIGIGIFVCPDGTLSEYPIWSEEDIAEGQKLLKEILEGSEENGVKPDYYIHEFIDKE